jgi:phosphoribosyl 1,2-cyclic phosphodiesterase
MELQEQGMTLRFTVLASGSAGNASLIEANGFGVLLDAGIGPRVLAGRLAAVGLGWHSIHACLLTHTHTDHWNDRTFAHLHRRAIPVYCHEDHHDELLNCSPSFPALRAAGIVHAYAANVELILSPALRCRPLPLRHDCGATFGFRFESTTDLFGPSAALGYAADLGCWDAELLAGLLDVDLLALEFNHDVELEYRSARHPRLIARVLGDDGHLSNEQAAKLLHEVLHRSTPGRLRHLVQLHLSRDCNRPVLALEAARTVLQGHDASITVHTAKQDVAVPTIALGGPAERAGPRVRRSPVPRALNEAQSVQPLLPGLECARRV